MLGRTVDADTPIDLVLALPSDRAELLYIVDASEHMLAVLAATIDGSRLGLLAAEVYARVPRDARSHLLPAVRLLLLEGLIFSLPPLDVGTGVDVTLFLSPRGRKLLEARAASSKESA